MKPRLFSVPAFRFSLADPKSAVGKWSRIATFGPKSKDGAEMMFDATTLGQMVDNAATRGDKIAIDNDHASAYPETRDAPALGFFGALAVVAGGRVVKSWNGSPDPAGLADGLYGRLDEITPRGEDPLVGLANYRTLSPMFVEEGTDEQNRPIGYALLNVAATNIPFQGGAEIMFFGVPGKSNVSRTSAAQAMAAYDSEGSQLNVGDDVLKTSDVQAGRRIRYKVTAVADGKNNLSPGWVQIGYQGNRNHDAGPASAFIKTQHGSMSSASSTMAAEYEIGDSVPADGATTMAAIDSTTDANGRIIRVGDRVVAPGFGAPEGGIVEAIEEYPNASEARLRGPFVIVRDKNWRSATLERNRVSKYSTSNSPGAAPANGATTNSTGAARAFHGATTMGLKFYVGDKVKTNINGGDTGVVTDVSGGYVTIDWDRVGIENYSERDLATGRHITKMSTGAARAFQGASMTPEMMQKIGLADGCSPQDKMAKYSAYAMGDASPEELKAMADDLDKLDDPSAKSMAAKMRKFALPFEGKETPEEEKAEAGKLAALARTLGVPATVAAIEAAVVPMSQFSALQGRLATIEAERAAEKKAAADRKVSELVDRAVAGGYPADQKDALTRFARADFGGAEALVARHVSQNATLFTSVSRGRGSSAPSASGSDVVERGAIVSFGRNLADAIKAHQKAHPKMSYEDAAAEVAATRPELAASYLSYGRQ